MADEHRNINRGSCHPKNPATPVLWRHTCMLVHSWRDVLVYQLPSQNHQLRRLVRCFGTHLESHRRCTRDAEAPCHPWCNFHSFFSLAFWKSPVSIQVFLVWIDHSSPSGSVLGNWFPEEFAKVPNFKAFTKAPLRHLPQQLPHRPCPGQKVRSWTWHGMNHAPGTIF